MLHATFSYSKVKRRTMVFPECSAEGFSIQGWGPGAKEVTKIRTFAFARVRGCRGHITWSRNAALSSVSQRLKSVNSHGDEGGSGRETRRTVVSFGFGSCRLRVASSCRVLVSCPIFVPCPGLVSSYRVFVCVSCHSCRVFESCPPVVSSCRISHRDAGGRGRVLSCRVASSSRVLAYLCVVSSSRVFVLVSCPPVVSS